ncbi:thioredoxin family protein [Salinibacillus xinjiangensis]|nr:thioredoxin family protein [Salinibacillus xinjiangensis]
MKKLIIFGAVIVVLFGALIFVVQYQKNQDADLYNNQITPGELQLSLDEGENKTIYFYSPECSHCQKATPVVVPLTEELGVNMEKVNVLEYDEAWNQFDIKATPTIIHYENGEEAARLVGAKPEEEFRAFFKNEVLN